MTPVSRHYTSLGNSTRPKTLMERNLNGLDLAREIEQRKTNEKTQECFFATLFALKSENYEPNLRPPPRDIAGAPYMEANSEQVSEISSQAPNKESKTFFLYEEK
jgi:hypothetical protein